MTSLLERANPYARLLTHFSIKVARLLRSQRPIRPHKRFPPFNPFLPRDDPTVIWNASDSDEIGKISEDIVDHLQPHASWH